MANDEIDTSKSLDELLGEATDENSGQKEPKSKSSESNSTPHQKYELHKVRIAAVIAIILVFIGVIYIFTKSNDEPTTQNSDTAQNEAPQNQQEEQQQAEIPFVSLITDSAYSSVSQDGSVTEVIPLSDSQEVIDIEEAKVAVATYSNTEINQITVFEETEEVLSFTIDNNNPSVANSVYDFKSNTLYALVHEVGTASIYAFNEENPNGALVHDPSQSDDLLLQPIAYASGIIFAQRPTCFDCDGPLLPEIWEINTETNITELGYRAPNSSILNAYSATVLPNETKIYFVATDYYTTDGIDEEGLKQSLNYIYEYDTASSSGKEVHSEEGLILRVVGVSDAANEILVSRSYLDEESEALLLPPVLGRLDTSGKSVRDLSLTLRRLDEYSSFSNAVSINERLMFSLFGDGGQEVYFLDLSDSGSGTIESLGTLDSTSYYSDNLGFFANSLQ